MFVALSGIYSKRGDVSYWKRAGKAASDGIYFFWETLDKNM